MPIAYASEVRRKLIHLTSSVFPLLYWLTDKRFMLGLASVAVAVCVAGELLRRYVPSTRALTMRWMGSILRDAETRGGWTGATWMAISGFLCILLLPKEIAIPAYLYLTVADAVAALVGRRFGRTRLWGPKSLEGSAAFVIAAIGVGLLCLPHEPAAVVLAAFLAAALELFPVQIGPLQVNDNIVIPLLGGAGLMLFVYAT